MVALAWASAPRTLLVTVVVRSVVAAAALPVWLAVRIDRQGQSLWVGDTVGTRDLASKAPFLRPVGGPFGGVVCLPVGPVSDAVQQSDSREDL